MTPLSSNKNSVDKPSRYSALVEALLDLIEDYKDEIKLYTEEMDGEEEFDEMAEADCFFEAVNVYKEVIDDLIRVIKESEYIK